MTPNPLLLEPKAHIRVVPGTQRAWNAVNWMGFVATCETLTLLPLFLGDPAVAMRDVFSGLFCPAWKKEKEGESLFEENYKDD